MFQVRPKRWIVERAFAWLNWSRRRSKDYELRHTSAETMIHIAFAHILLSRYNYFKIRPKEHFRTRFSRNVQFCSDFHDLPRGMALKGHSYCGGAVVAVSARGGVCVTCPAFSCACSALSLATLDLVCDLAIFARALAAFAFALEASSSRFCCLRCDFRSLLLMVPVGSETAVVGADGSVGAPVGAEAGVAGTACCATTLVANIAQNTREAKSIKRREELIIIFSSKE